MCIFEYGVQRTLVGSADVVAEQAIERQRTENFQRRGRGR